MNHQLIEEELEPPMETLDEEDLQDLMSEVYCVLHAVNERKLPKQLHSDVVGLLNRVEACISWHKLH